MKGQKFFIWVAFFGVLSFFGYIWLSHLSILNSDSTMSVVWKEFFSGVLFFVIAGIGVAFLQVVYSSGISDDVKQMIKDLFIALACISWVNLIAYVFLQINSNLVGPFLDGGKQMGLAIGLLFSLYGAIALIFSFFAWAMHNEL